MAFVFAFILLCNIGYDLPVLAGVTEGYPAEEAGMQAGDTILKIDHTRIHFSGTSAPTHSFIPGTRSQ